MLANSTVSADCVGCRRKMYAFHLHEGNIHLQYTTQLIHFELVEVTNSKQPIGTDALSGHTYLITR